MKFIAQKRVVRAGSRTKLEVHAFTPYEFVDGSGGIQPVYVGVVYAVFDGEKGLYTTHPTPTLGAATGWVDAIEQMALNEELRAVADELEVLRSSLESERDLLRRHDARIASDNDVSIIEDWMSTAGVTHRHGGLSPP